MQLDMIVGERKLFHPTAHVPLSSLYDDPTAMMHHHRCSHPLPVSGVAGGGNVSPLLLDKATLVALQRFLPSDSQFDGSLIAADEEDEGRDVYSSDELMMYEFKVRRCPRGRAHDWTACPYVHPDEKARRRDPRRFHYSGSPCPEYRKGGGFCRRGDACDHAHGVFETWLHPARYRTQPCKDGTACPRRVCFFAHTIEQLRVVLPEGPKSPDYSLDMNMMLSLSPKSTLALPPESPQSDQSPPLSPVRMEDLMDRMLKVRLSKAMPGTPFGGARAGNLCLDFGNVPTKPWGIASASHRWEEEPADALPDLEWISELVD